MPQKFRHYVMAPGRLIPEAASTIWGYVIEFGSGAVTFELTTFNGYRMIKVVAETGVGEFWNEFVYLGAPAADVIPARYALTDAGFSTQFYTNYRPGFFPATWADVKTLWNTSIVPFIVAAIDWSTNGSTGTVVYHEITSAADHFGHYVAVIPIFTDAEVLVYQAGCYGLNNGEGYDFQGLAGADLPAPESSQQAEQTAQALAKIAQALSDLTRMNRVTWINNEGGYADLLSGDIVTPP